jgi:hypothetical protein
MTVSANRTIGFEWLEILLLFHIKVIRVIFYYYEFDCGMLGRFVPAEWRDGLPERSLLDSERWASGTRRSRLAWVARHSVMGWVLTLVVGLAR